jgi:intraflagellar transport protein 46
LAVDVNDSEEIESDEEDDEVNVDVNVQQKPQQIQNKAPQQKPAAAAEEEDDDDDEKEVPGAYNPTQFANLPVSSEIKELFEYINRYKPQKIDLETKLKPFIPDYIPAVGEVDAFLKMPKPDGSKEDLGITVLDEPALNHEDKTVLELKYFQSKNVVRAAPIDVDSIEHADKKPKEVSRWINSVSDLHKSRPPPTVNYTKNMPDIDTLMQEWNPEMEAAFK